MEQKRIWELDALRGLCLMGMVVVHAVYDLVELYGIISWQYPPVFAAVKDWGGVLFLLISGICVTLGSRHIRRGLTVIGGGLIVTAVTVAMEKLGFTGPGFAIHFGVLHCLGVCMLLWSVFRRCKTGTLTVLGAAMVAAGLLLRGLRFDTPWLIPLGFVPVWYASSDFFPVLPYLGFFLLGAAFGRGFYAEKKTLLPRVNSNALPIRFLSRCGKLSLWIYLLHQPVLAGIMELILLIRK